MRREISVPIMFFSILAITITLGIYVRERPLQNLESAYEYYLNNYPVENKAGVLKNGSGTVLPKNFLQQELQMQIENIEESGRQLSSENLKTEKTQTSRLRVIEMLKTFR